MNAMTSLFGHQHATKRRRNTSPIMPAAQALESRTLLSSSGFGNQGTVLTPFTGSLDDAARSLLVQSNGMLVAAGASNGSVSLARYTRSGTLDPTFGSRGKISTTLPDSSVNSVSAALEADQNILVVASLTESVSDVSSVVLARYTPSGQLDPDFGIAGVVPVLAGLTSNSYAAALPGGQIVVAGALDNSNTSSTFVVEEYQANGALNTSFGTNGRVSTVVGPSGYLDGIAVQGNDIIVSGGATNLTTSKSEMVLARYTAAGVLDATFGTAGLASYPLDGNARAYGVAVAPNDSVFVVGTAFSSTPSPSNTAFITQLSANGTIDSAYGAGGMVNVKNLQGTSITIQSNGEAVVAGTASGTAGYGIFTRSSAARFTTSGAPDATFGTAGVVTSAFTASDAITAVALQPTSAGTRIVIAGSGFDPATGSDFLLARYTTTGVVDTSFGSAGSQTADFAGPVAASAQSTAPDGHGGTLVAGTTASANGALTVADYQADGQLNPKFGTGGIVQVTFNSYLFSTLGGYVAVQADGKILIVGTSIQPGSTNYDFAITRLLPSGKLDSTFGKGGKLTTFSGAADTDMGASGGVAIQPDGKILVAGYTEYYGAFPPADKGVVIRYNTNGSLDNTFGVGGRETFNMPGNYPSRTTAIALEPDGKILIGGYATSPVTDEQTYFFQKLYTNGFPDTAFAPLGQILTAFSGAFGSGGGGPLLLLPNGNILIAGTTYNSVTFQSYLAAAEFNPTGTPDLGFGNAGQASIGFPGNPMDTNLFLNDIALLPDGKVLIIGSYSAQSPTTGAPVTGDFALAQFTSAGKLDPSFGSGGTELSGFGTGLLAASAVQVQGGGDFEVVGSSSDPNSQFSEFALAEYSADGSLVP